MKNARAILVYGVAALALVAAGGLAATTKFSLKVLSASDLPPSHVASLAPSEIVEAEPSPQTSAWLSMFPSARPVPVHDLSEPPLPAISVMWRKAPIDAPVDLRVASSSASPAQLRFEMAFRDPDGDVDHFSTSSSAKLKFAKSRENVEINNADLPDAPDMAAMAPVIGEDFAGQELNMLSVTEPSMEVPASVAAIMPVADDFNPFGGFGLVSDPVSSLVDSYATERHALESANLAVEDAEYVEPFAKPEADPKSALAGANGDIDIALLAGMSPEQIEASIALVAALRNPDQAQTYLDRLQGVSAPQPVRQLPPVQMTGIPGLNDELQIPSMQGEPPMESGNLLTRGWEAIDNYGVVALRRDGDASTDLVIEEGMVLGALGPVVSIHRTSQSLIVETEKAGEIRGVPYLGPRLRPEWLYGPN